MTDNCKCYTCKKVREKIKEVQERNFESITMNKDRYLEDFQELLDEEKER